MYASGIFTLNIKFKNQYYVNDNNNFHICTYNRKIKYIGDQVVMDNRDGQSVKKLLINWKRKKRHTNHL